MRPFTIESAGSDAFVTTADEPNIGEQTIEDVRTFVEKQTGDNYKPHITVGISDARPTSEFAPVQFKIETLAVYQLGNVGTARRNLWRYSGR